MDTTWQIIALLLFACGIVTAMHVRDFMRGMNKVHHSREDEGT